MLNLKVVNNKKVKQLIFNGYYMQVKKLKSLFRSYRSKFKTVKRRFETMIFITKRKSPLCNEPFFVSSYTLRKNYLSLITLCDTTTIVKKLQGTSLDLKRKNKHSNLLQCKLQLKCICLK